MRALGWVWIASIACGACAAETTRDVGDLGESDTSDGGVSVPRSSETRELACVSAATIEGDEAVPFVWRVSASVRAGTALVVFGRSQQFTSHDGAFSGGGETKTTTASAIEDEGGISLAADEDPPTTLRLERHDEFFTGEFRRADVAETLLCWDRLEVFGSPWAQRPAVFPAHFDEGLGLCVDGEGLPASNDLPVAFVRETSFGECADLRDAALNDEDFGSPDLYLNLRGALLDGATLHFANLSASLEGARLRKLVFGYATITGRIDGSTELPVGTACTVVESPWAGNQVTCVQ